VKSECGEETNDAMRNALRGLCETVMLSWTRTTSDIEAPAHAHDRAFVSSHAKI